MYVHLTEHLEPSKINIFGVIVYVPLILVLIASLIFIIAIETYFLYYSLNILTDWKLSLGLFLSNGTILGIIGIFRIGKSIDVNEFNREFETGPKFFSSIIVMAFGFIFLIVGVVSFFSLFVTLNPEMFPTIPEAMYPPINDLISFLLNLVMGFILLIPSWKFLRKESKKRRNWQKNHRGPITFKKI